MNEWILSTLISDRGTSHTSVLCLMKIKSHSTERARVNVTFQTESRKLEHLYTYAIDQYISSADISVCESYNAAWRLK